MNRVLFIFPSCKLKSIIEENSYGGSLRILLAVYIIKKMISSVSQVTKDSYQELTFRDVVYWRRFQQEHDTSYK